eukprot:TRINITY_DN1641_c0_g1_i1.p1 TRINITY_DN1641_c0_g1~~TRINITY_DN1641_c0_g1_i1.p1  ORF type:complete len:124 (-),score=17.82 TRINITY_DN1641_c0_g1_i1:238-609(-)
MASAFLKNAQTQASTASRFVSTHGSALYRQILERNQKYIVDNGNIEKAGELTKQAIYTNIASIPKRYEHALKDVDVLKQKWSNRAELPLSEVGIGAIFVAELFAWFCVGEIVGRGFTVTGYKV